MNKVHMTIQNLENQYDGERIFLVGNGPSLKKTPLDSLTDEYSLAMNGINFIYDQTEWRPMFYFFFQSNFNQTKRKHVEENIRSGRICFLNDIFRKVFGKHDNVYYIPKRELKYDPVNEKKNLNRTSIAVIKAKSPNELLKFWSDDLTLELYTYHSMYGAIQLAVYMGFSKIYLIGCDLGFKKYNPFLLFNDGLDPLEVNISGNGQHELVNSSYAEFFRKAVTERRFLKSSANGLMYMISDFFNLTVESRLAEFLSNNPDPNHFDPDYHLQLKDNRYANLEITKSHVLAKKITPEKGTEIYNATVGGDLEVYPRRDIDSLL